MNLGGRRGYLQLSEVLPAEVLTIVYRIHCSIPSAGSSAAPPAADAGRASPAGWLRTSSLPVRRLVAALCLLHMLGCSQLPTPAAGPTPVPDRAALERQILVTLTQASPAPLRGAGSSSRQYTASTDYSQSERTRRTVARLARQYRLLQVEGWPIRALGVYCVIFEIPAGRPLAEVVRRLESDRRVESVQPMQTFQVLAPGPRPRTAPGSREPSREAESPAVRRDAPDIYDDPYIDMQHGLGAMRVLDVHPWAGGRGIDVAVVDTGVDDAHPDLAASLALVKDFVLDRPRSSGVAELHGTAVAGVIAATANNGIGTVGVAPAARILALRACWEEADGESSGTCNSFTLAKALAFVVDRRPNIVNLSLAGPPDPLLERLLRAAMDKGIAVVTAYERRSETTAFPGSLEGVMVVQSDAAGTSDDPVSLLRAPGQDILATRPGNGYDFVSGSSFAAAHVSGVVALLLERAPDLDRERLDEILRSTTRPVAGPRGATTHLVDACAAFDRAVPGSECASTAATSR